MLQRIQSIFLAIVVISGVLSFVFPIASYMNPDRGTYELTVIGLKHIESQTFLKFTLTSPMWILTIISILLTGIAIFVYHNRRRQVLLVHTAFLVNIILIALVYLLYSNRIFRENIGVEPSYGLGAFLPLISIVFLVLASRSIRKDEALVKSADRLR